MRPEGQVKSYISGEVSYVFNVSSSLVFVALESQAIYKENEHTDNVFLLTASPGYFIPKNLLRGSVKKGKRAYINMTHDGDLQKFMHGDVVPTILSFHQT